MKSKKIKDAEANVLITRLYLAFFQTFMIFSRATRIFHRKTDNGFIFKRQNT
jgi:hypothetical protein